MSFTTAGHTVEENEFVSNYLDPGIHEAKIQKIEYTEPPSGTPGMKITHEGRPDGDTPGQIAETTWWLSPKAWDNNWKKGDPSPPGWTTKAKIAIMADKLEVREGLDAIDILGPEEYVKAVALLFQGKVARWKFAGKEILGKEGKANWTKAELATYSFIEILDVSPSKLKFDPTNEWDMKKLPVADSEVPSSNGVSSEETSSNSDDDPWIS